MMYRFILALSCFLMMLAAPISAQDFDRGVAAYNNGDYATALKEWKPLPDAGSISAQSNLGLMYANGRGVPQDYKEAAKWYTLAAEQGHTKAQTKLGEMYVDGNGVPQVYKLAQSYFELAA